MVTILELKNEHFAIEVCPSSRRTGTKTTRIPRPHSGTALLVSVLWGSFQMVMATKQFQNKSPNGFLLNFLKTFKQKVFFSKVQVSVSNWMIRSVKVISNGTCIFKQWKQNSWPFLCYSLPVSFFIRIIRHNRTNLLSI